MWITSPRLVTAVVAAFPLAQLARAPGDVEGVDAAGARLAVRHPEACEPECPVNAIYAEDDLPEDQAHFQELNAALAKEWPVITEQKDPPADADDWANKPDKLEHLER